MPFELYNWDLFDKIYTNNSYYIITPYMQSIFIIIHINRYYSTCHNYFPNCMTNN